MYADDPGISRELDCIDDFWVGSNAVFINDFLVDSKLCVVTIPVPATELNCVDDF
jgi:hypothetical protein